jgi:Zn ribbon nucleic-acid-binding protein
MKYIEILTKCAVCNEVMNHRLPCGCLICGSCSKNKILLFHEDNNIKIPLSVCSCGYILNDKDKKIIINN